MTLKEFLRDVRTPPFDADTLPLTVREGDLTVQQLVDLDALRTPEHGALPYVLLEIASAATERVQQGDPQYAHLRRVDVTGFIHVLQQYDVTNPVLEPEDALAQQVFFQAQFAPHHVTHDLRRRPLIPGTFTLTQPIDPRPVNYDRYAGLHGRTTFSYSYFQP